MQLFLFEIGYVCIPFWVYCLVWVQDLVWGRQFHDEDEEGGVLSRAQGVEEQVLEADLDQVT